MEEPSTSRQAQAELEPDGSSTEAAAVVSDSQENSNSQRTLEDADLDKMMTVEEFLLKSKTYMIEYEKHMFLDTIDSDCLVVCAKYVAFTLHFTIG